MQTKKMSLANIQGKLSRVEMKNIMAGSAVCTLGCAWTSGIMCGSTNCENFGTLCLVCGGHQTYLCC